MTTLQKLGELTNGKKTYFAAGLLAVFAISGLLTGNLDSDRVVELLLEAAALAGLRHAIFHE